VHDEIDLEGGLREKGYDGQDVRAVVGYLRERLQWRVQTVRFPGFLFSSSLVSHCVM
jgi:hypothetical protein